MCFFYTVQEDALINEKYAKTFSIDARLPEHERAAIRARMLEKGMFEQPPVFVCVKYDPGIFPVNAFFRELLSWGRDGKKGLNMWNATCLPGRTRSRRGKIIDTLDARSVFVSFPEDRRKEFEAVRMKFPGLSKATVGSTFSEKSAGETCSEEEEIEF